jgi:hypothetical protein
VREIVFTMVAVVACNDASQRPEPAKASGAPAQPAVVIDAKPAAIPDAKLTATVFHLSCEKIVPQYVRDKLIAGGKPFEQLGPNAVTCTFGGRDAPVVGVSCGDWGDADVGRLMEHGKKLAHAKNVRDVPGVGRAAYQADGDLVGIPMKVVRFFDDDTPCYVDVFAKKTWKVDLAKALVATINPDAIK